MFYKGLHTIQGTKERRPSPTRTNPTASSKTSKCRWAALREELHIFAKNRGTMVGNITIVDNGDEIDCRRMGSGGYAIPSITEPDVIQFKKCDAKFVLHVEKGHGLGPLQRRPLLGKAQLHPHRRRRPAAARRAAAAPPASTRKLKLPIYCLLDCDPWGHYIYSVIKQGSISLAFESERLAIPDAKFLGIRAKDYDECELTDDVQIELNDNDKKRANEIAAYPWFKDHKGWQKEIAKMLSQRLQDGSRIADHEGHQLRDGGVRARAAEEEGLAGLSRPVHQKCNPRRRSGPRVLFLGLRRWIESGCSSVYCPLSCC